MGHWRKRWCRPTHRIGLVVVLALAGCLGGPRPPALQQGKALYRNKQEGFSLAPPPGWSQLGISNPSREDRGHDCQLVKYKRLTGTKAAFFLVWVVEVPAGTDLATYWAARPPDKNWKRIKANEPIEVDHVSALRELLSGKWDKEIMYKEVVVVQRGTRVYQFVGEFPANDDEAWNQVRDAVESVVWEGEPKS